METPQSTADKIKTDAQAFMNLVPGGKITNLTAGLATVMNAVQAVERLASDLKGADKKSIVIWILDQYVHIPLVPQFLFDDIAEYLIDAFVAWLNLKIGKDWVGKILS